ncbi:hypothetical protein BS47DRAFT_1370085, partial [Hydnum rufescens UP504]
MNRVEEGIVIEGVIYLGQGLDPHRAFLAGGPLWHWRTEWHDFSVARRVPLKEMELIIALLASRGLWRWRTSEENFLLVSRLGRAHMTRARLSSIPGLLDLRSSKSSFDMGSKEVGIRFNGGVSQPFELWEEGGGVNRIVGMGLDQHEIQFRVVNSGGGSRGGHLWVASSSGGLVQGKGLAIGGGLGGGRDRGESRHVLLEFVKAVVDIF